MSSEPIIILSDDEDDGKKKKHAKHSTTTKGKQNVSPKTPPRTSTTTTKKNERQLFTWFLIQKFDSHDLCNDFIRGERVWSKWYQSNTEAGSKQYYRCNRVKYSAKQCQARIYTRYTKNDPDVLLFSNNLEHDHHQSVDPSPHHLKAMSSTSNVRLQLTNLKQEDEDQQPLGNYVDDVSSTMDCADDDYDEDDYEDDGSIFIDTSLLRVEIDEEDYGIVEPYQMDDYDQDMADFDEDDADDSSETTDVDINDDIVLVEDSDGMMYPYSPTSSFGMQRQSPDSSTHSRGSNSSGVPKIAKVESAFDIQNFLQESPKTKFGRMNWSILRKFSSHEDAKAFINEERIWSKWYFSSTEEGAKQYYRCNKVKYSGRQCASRLYLLYENISQDVYVMVNGKDHDHDSQEFKCVIHLTDELKELIRKCLQLKQKPKDIITKLEKLNIPLPSRYYLRKFMTETQEQLAIFGGF